MNIIKFIAGIFGHGAGATVGNLTTNLAALAALAPLGIWLVANKEGVFVTITYGDAAFWGVLLFVLLKMAHYSRTGSAVERRDYIP